VTHPPASSPDWKDWLAALRRVLGIAARYRNTTPKNPGRAIHLYRARIKEARALLRLAPPSLRTAAKTCRDELARASRTLSAARDAVVVTETVRELIRQNHKLDRGSLPPELLGDTAGSKDRDRALLKQASTDAHRVRARLSAWPEPQETPDILASRATRALRRARKSVPQSFRKATPEAMHDFRKAVIICRYQSAFMNKAYGAGNPTLALSLEKLRKKLGQLNDLYRLEAELTRFSPDTQSDTMTTLGHAIKRAIKRLKKASKQRAHKALSPANSRDARHPPGKTTWTAHAKKAPDNMAGFILKH
jgi:CHAD domain-containing protein